MNYQQLSLIQIHGAVSTPGRQFESAEFELTSFCCSVVGCEQNLYAGANLSGCTWRVQISMYLYVAVAMHSLELLSATCAHVDGKFMTVGMEM